MPRSFARDPGVILHTQPVGLIELDALADNFAGIDGTCRPQQVAETLAAARNAPSRIRPL